MTHRHKIRPPNFSHDSHVSCEAKINTCSFTTHWRIMACIAHVIEIMIKMAATPYVSSQDREFPMSIFSTS